MATKVVQKKANEPIIKLTKKAVVKPKDSEKKIITKEIYNKIANKIILSRASIKNEKTNALHTPTENKLPKTIKPTIPSYVQMPTPQSEHEKLLIKYGFGSSSQKDNLKFLSDMVKALIEREDRRNFQHAIIDVVKLSHPSCEVTFERVKTQCKISFKDGNDQSFCLVDGTRVI